MLRASLLPAGVQEGQSHLRVRRRLSSADSHPMKFNSSPGKRGLKFHDMQQSQGGNYSQRSFWPCWLLLKNKGERGKERESEGKRGRARSQLTVGELRLSVRRAGGFWLGRERRESAGALSKPVLENIRVYCEGAAHQTAGPAGFYTRVTQRGRNTNRNTKES